MSQKWERIRARLQDLGWDVSVLDAAEAEVRAEGRAECEATHKPPRRAIRRRKEDQ